MTYITRHDIHSDHHPRPLGYRIREALDCDDRLTYGWISPSGVTQNGYRDLAGATRGAWVDHNTAARLNLNA